jgi:hypothetical protein
MGACSVCGVLLEPATALYTETGELICQRCTTARQVKAGHEKSAATAKSLAYGNIAVGVASFFYDPMFALSVGAIGNAIFVLRRVRDDRQRGEVIDDARPRQVAAVIGAILGAASLVVRLIR